MRDILNGDHAEFEIKHATTPPRERPDWPLPSFDAKDWAQVFIEKNPDSGVGEDVMIGWFANALMRGHDERRKLQSAEAERAMRHAADEIMSMRRRIEVLQAKVDIMDLFALALTSRPQGGVTGMTEDPACMLQRALRSFGDDRPGGTNETA